MARTDLTRTDITRAGVDPAATPGQADGHMFANSGKEFVEVENADATPRAVTFQTPRTIEGLAITDLVVTIPATGRRLIGPFSSETFGQPRNSADAGKVYIDYAAGFEAQLSTRLYRLP